MLSDIKTCNSIWDALLTKLFGKQSIKFMDNFGRYLILRQQMIYKYKCNYPNIYKDRGNNYYDCDFFESAPLENKSINYILQNDPLRP